MNVLLAPLLSAALTEIAKWLGETVMPEWPALASKLVNVIIAYLLTNQTSLHLPASLVPSIQGFQGPLAALVVAVGAQFIHDVATWASRQAGIASPGAVKLGVALKTKGG